MDVKTLAKSKRAHSEHHSQKHHHPNPTLIAPTSGTSSGMTLRGKQVREELYQSQSLKALPSNLDRYEEEYDLDCEDRSKSRINQASGDASLRNKGANYSYVLSEARAHSEANVLPESLPSLDDLLTDCFGCIFNSRRNRVAAVLLFKEFQQIRSCWN